MNTFIRTKDPHNDYAQKRRGLGQCGNAMYIDNGALRMAIIFTHRTYTETQNTGLCADLARSLGARAYKIYITSAWHYTSPLSMAQSRAPHQWRNSLSACKSASVL